ncbi:cysteine desulfurase [Aliifodinibius sp. S!AR15-10]|uniref:cysteine desulfurase family protein n=1 Tax=Aliifodinibius sp. S!AR15-10 TaxID=2950437 RepID=UPI00285F2C23|nr:cysteine desulfurase family protein [Aliifodinibius sp. S!AR15-10]MDR8390335.1 cysteine desulfurase [Aliifodinibius sp. S!AR15-10]
MKTVYFDHAATTPVDERVVEAMIPYFTEHYGNANSTHELGSSAKVAVEEARETVAEIIGAEPAEIIFTSGGTESDNTAIKGVVEATGKKEVITSPLEHHAVLHTVEALKRHGIKPVYVEPEAGGTVSPDKVANAITDETALVSLMHVNNEIGSINPICEIAEVCDEHDVLFHSDTVQSIGKLPVDVDELGLDFLSMSGHKIYGPKGIGVMYMRHGSAWIPWMHGGSQERRRRGGTLNVPGIVGLAEALELITKKREEHWEHFKKLRSKLAKGLYETFGDTVQVNGPAEGQGVPHIMNLSFTNPSGGGLDGEMLLLNLDVEGICVSNGSACTSGALEPSHVLEGIGMKEDVANSSIRISMGKDNTEEEIDYLIEKLKLVVDRMKTVTA